MPPTLEIRVCDRFEVNPASGFFGFCPPVKQQVISIETTCVASDWVWVRAHPVRGPTVFYSPRVSFATP